LRYGIFGRRKRTVHASPLRTYHGVYRVRRNIFVTKRIHNIKRGFVVVDNLWVMTIKTTKYERRDGAKRFFPTGRVFGRRGDRVMLLYYEIPSVWGFHNNLSLDSTKNPTQFVYTSRYIITVYLWSYFHIHILSFY